MRTPLELRRLRFALSLLLLLALGCNSLPPGDPASLRTLSPSATTAPAAAPVILLRGWRDLWSDGIDALAAKLKADGVEAAVFKQNQSGDVGDAMVAAARAGTLHKPLVLIGFSYGADDSIANARRLNDVGQPVDLLVLIDPVTPAPVPPNVRRCLNLFQSNGAWDVFPWLRGVPVTDDPERLEQYAPAENVDLRNRPDLLDPDTSHKTIAGSAKVHAAIVEAVRTTRPK